jgi:hypothetical protein
MTQNDLKNGFPFFKGSKNTEWVPSLKYKEEPFLLLICGSNSMKKCMMSLVMKGGKGEDM